MTTLHPRPRTRTPVDVRIARVAEPHFPLATRAALRAVGVFGRPLVDRLADGRLCELFAPVIVVGVRPENVTPDLVCAAAVLVGGPAAALDGASALERRGLWDRHDGNIFVATARGRDTIRYRVPRTWRRDRTWRKRPRAITIRFVRDPGSPTAPSDLLGGIRTRTSLAALVRAARTLSAHQLASVIKHGQYRREFTLDEIDAALASHAGNRGMRALRRAVELRRQGSAGTKSRSEDLMIAPLVAAFGEPAVNVRGIAGIPTHEPDFCWPDRRWIVEVDGDHHLEDPQQREADRRSDAQLRAAGWIVVRIHWSRVWDELPRVMFEIRRAFAA